ncbi:hypothetical protein [Arthrobacter humicola]|uniref:hypothetical protein n=1 Tax=Arthrobacter humicola TaxID=409291 RepID=UPI001FAE0BCA|nr:hypothetical protein [Arthrobacter humicola]MCI9870578.1 hypothetical protein [Arthrobacter humicola]
MSFYNEPFNLANPRSKEVLKIAFTGFTDKKPMQDFIGMVGIEIIDVEWEGRIRDIWPDALETIAKAGKLRQFLTTARDDMNYTAMRERIENLIAVCDQEAEIERADLQRAERVVDHTKATIVGRRPFVNRVTLRDNLKSLFDENGDRAMIVQGPPSSGRSYTWVLVSYVAKKVGGFDTKLIDLSRFKDTQATPVDVARMIAAAFGWQTSHKDEPQADETAMDITNARVLSLALIKRLSELGKVCLVFDGLDGANLADPTLDFIGDIAAAAGNDELGDCRVVLLAFNRALNNPIVDPYVPREPTIASIPLNEIITFFQDVAAERGAELTDEQAKALANKLFGKPPPDPLPMSLMRVKAAELSTAACSLRGS